MCVSTILHPQIPPTSLSRVIFFIMASSSSSPTVQQSVQQVSKASSDELLRKFSVQEDEPAPSRTKVVQGPSMRRKRSRKVASILGARDLLKDGGGGAGGGGCRDVGVSASGKMVMKNRRSNDGGGRGMVEWKALLPGSPRTTSASSMRLGHKDAGFDGIGLFLAALDKSWRKAIKGASKIFIEKNRSSPHIRLIGDVV